MLTPADYRLLLDRWIDHFWADASGIERVDSITGAQLVGQDHRKKDCSGLAIHYFMPPGVAEARGSLGGKRATRLRRDYPDPEQDTKTGGVKYSRKYLAAPGSGSHIYFPPLVTAASLADTNLPIIITEAELKALALRRLASYQLPSPNGIPPMRFLPLGIAGVWNWKGKVGKQENSDGTTSDIRGPSNDFTFLELMKRQVLIAFDADFRSNPKVRSARWHLSQYLMDMGCSVGFLEWALEIKGKQAKGIDDWLARDGPEAVLEAIAKAEYRDGTDWRSRLLRTDNGKVKPLLENARIALSESNEWRGALQHDEFLGRLICTHRPWSNESGIWRDEDSMRAACWLQTHGIEVSKDIAYYAAITAALKTDSGRDWILSLKWDGEPRIHIWLPYYMNVGVTHDGRDISNYIAEVGRIWLIGGAGRLIEPGCQMDYTLVFCGGEGQGKSNALRALGHNWFTDSLEDIHNRETLIDLQGNWLVEFAELDPWRRGDWKGLRAFLTRRNDKFRSKYGHFWEEHPRRCIFSATTNEDWFLESGSEGRRFLPVRCVGDVRKEELERDMEQLWAEAAFRWQEGERPDFRDPSIIALASEERESFKQSDPWHEPIREYLGRHMGDSVTVTEILREAIKQETARMTKIDQARVIASLKTLKYEPCQVGPRDHRTRGWRLAEVTVNGNSH